MTQSEPLRLLVMLRRLRGEPDGSAADDVLGTCERAALAAAMTLREETDAHVTAIALGPARREDRVLAMALRAGCDRAARIYDRQLHGLDYLGVANILAAAANHFGFDAILCGDRSQDECQGAMGPAMAELLEVPHVSSTVTDLTVEDRALVVTRRADGRIQRLRVPTPAVIGVARFERRATPPAEEPLEDAQLDDRPTPARKPPRALLELDLADLSLEPLELRHRARFLGFARPVRTPRQPVLLRTAADLQARLRDDHLVE